MSVHKFIDNVKRRSSPFYSILHHAYRRSRNVEIPFPKFFLAFLYSERLFRHQLWKWVKNKFYYEPLLRYRCTSVGKNLSLDGDMPLIEGSGNIFIGNNVTIGNRCAWIVTPNLFKNPTLIIGDNTTINYLTGISVECRVEIGNNCVIAGETMIFDNNSHSLHFENDRKMTKDDVASIKIEDHVWIGMRSFIGKGITIGKGSVVAAFSVVTKDVPEMTLVGGNPARVIKKIEKH